MEKGVKEIMIAIGGGKPEDGGEPENNSSLPKKRKVYVDEQVYSRLMQNGEAEDAESLSDAEPLAEKELEPMPNPSTKMPERPDPATEDDEEMPEGIDFDDDEDDQPIKKLSRLFGKMKRG